jgi:ribosomal protein S18 acetylase RimI-like enzyme
MVTGGAICYFKRYKMEVDLHDLPAAWLPPGFASLPWSAQLLETHAQVLYSSFFQEIDSNVFPSLSSPDGCRMLMTEISRKWGFLPSATWLLTGPDGPCGTVQGVRERTGLGAIQNLGILPAWRARGLGRGLLLYALHGFWAAGLGRALLEVTAQNDGAIRLYHRMGFRRRKTLYKAVGDQHAGISAPLL